MRTVSRDRVAPVGALESTLPSGALLCGTSILFFLSCCSSCSLLHAAVVAFVPCHSSSRPVADDAPTQLFMICFRSSWTFSNTGVLRGTGARSVHENAPRVLLRATLLGAVQRVLRALLGTLPKALLGHSEPSHRSSFGAPGPHWHSCSWPAGLGRRIFYHDWCCPPTILLE